MKYVPPAGEAAGAAYVDGNRSAGTKGSVVPAGAIEYPQREIDHVISFFGLTPANTDLEQLRKAIEAAIAAATGAGDTSQFLLVAQARARLPIFPEILSADGKMNVTSPSAGTVQVPSAVDFQHRGIYPISTSSYLEAARTFATLANKTYHVRWNPTDGFALKDLSNGAYNPSALDEADASFDSAYDDMLVSRVVTSAGNVATIINLVNRDRLWAHISAMGSMISPSTNDSRTLFNFSYSWARTPKQKSFFVTHQSYNDGVIAPLAPGVPPDNDIAMWTPGSYPSGILHDAPATRYGSSFEYQMDYASAISLAADFGA